MIRTRPHPLEPQSKPFVTTPEFVRFFVHKGTRKDYQLKYNIGTLISIVSPDFA